MLEFAGLVLLVVLVLVVDEVVGLVLVLVELSAVVVVELVDGRGSTSRGPYGASPSASTAWVVVRRH